MLPAALFQEPPFFKIYQIMKQLIIVLALFCAVVNANAQSDQKNLVIVTLDGFRWQEVFSGADTALIHDNGVVRDTSDLIRSFYATTPEERRKKLLPFFWNTIVQKGQLYGNRVKGSMVNNANPYWFSYPGYNEIFTGFPDTAVNSNDKIWNKNTNVLEFINQQKGYRGKVAAFSTWDVFPYILNVKRSGIYVNADVDTLSFRNQGLQLINDMQFLAPRPIGVRPDLLTYFAAREYLKAYHPRVLYIAFDETDDFAHEGMYDQYLGSAHAEDAMIADLWNTLQSIPGYKDNTTLLITCDHGRGDQVKSQWRHHGSDIPDAGQIWFAVMGPGLSPSGEIKNGPVLYQGQLAATMAALLGFTFRAEHSVMPVIEIPKVY